jgi:hypothetical protein
MTVGGRVLIIDAANVVGSRPDGWWRDRAGATERLRDEIGRAVAAGRLPDFAEVVLVVEGRARGVTGISGVRVEPAERSGDDAIVALVHGLAPAGGHGPGRDARPGATIVTADRGLRDRVLAAGAEVVGPSTFHGWVGRSGG